MAVCIAHATHVCAYLTSAAWCVTTSLSGLSSSGLRLPYRKMLRPCDAHSAVSVRLYARTLPTYLLEPGAAQADRSLDNEGMARVHIRPRPATPQVSRVRPTRTRLPSAHRTALGTWPPSLAAAPSAHRAVGCTPPAGSNTARRARFISRPAHVAMCLCRRVSGHAMALCMLCLGLVVYRAVRRWKLDLLEQVKELQQMRATEFLRRHGAVKLASQLNWVRRASSHPSATRSRPHPWAAVRRTDDRVGKRAIDRAQLRRQKGAQRVAPPLAVAQQLLQDLQVHIGWVVSHLPAAAAHVAGSVAARARRTQGYRGHGPRGARGECARSGAAARPSATACEGRPVSHKGRGPRCAGGRTFPAGCGSGEQSAHMA
jgi:hypothetical protein